MSIKLQQNKDYNAIHIISPFFFKHDKITIVKVKYSIYMYNIKPVLY
jgi:hypothetical protein